MINSTVAFVGIFERITDPNNRATSSAGNQVQCEIVDVLEGFKVSRNMDVCVFAAKPTQAWPKGPFCAEVRCDGDFESSTILNIPYLKRIHFSIKLLQFLMSCRPSVVFSYNPGFFDSIVLLLWRWIFGERLNLISIIQDVHAGVGSAWGVRWIGDFFSMRLARRFDLLIPISECIADDFGFDRSKVVVFGGGLTRQGRALLDSVCVSPSPHAVFAGALEPYNGIDRLILAWRDVGSNLVLHVFGRGSCEKLVRDAANECVNIVFHGFSSEEVVAGWQTSASVNFCLRYSVGINARYFFPSKFFNVLAAPGIVIVNKFEGLPAELEGFCCVVEDDLADLRLNLTSIRFDDHFAAILDARRNWLRINAGWDIVIRDALDCFLRNKV